MADQASSSGLDPVHIELTRAQAERLRGVVDCEERDFELEARYAASEASVQELEATLARVLVHIEEAHRCLTLIGHAPRSDNTWAARCQAADTAIQSARDSLLPALPEEAREQKVNYAAEVMLDFMASAAEGKDDDELVFAQAEVDALARVCGVDPPEVEVMTAKQVRANVRAGKRALAEGDGP